MPSPEYFVFVDFENVPKLDLALVAGKPVHVTLLIGRNQKRLDTPFSLQMHRMADQVTPIEVGASGRNALDITLACYLGMQIQRTPDAEFFIVSRDKDYTPMIEHLTADGRKVSRHDSFATLPFLAAPRRRPVTRAPFVAKVPSPTPKPAAPAPRAPVAPKAAVLPAKAPPKPRPPVDKYDKLVGRIRNGQNRPGTRARLERYIHDIYGQKSTPEQRAGVVSQLSADGIISVDANGRVKYV